jgi:two-component system nitrogen regulation response regulator NtrX
MLKILYADDEKSVLVLFKITLEQKNIACTCVENGKDAIEKVKQNNYDLIILDSWMPEMTGYDTLLEIKKLNIKTPIFIFSGDNKEDTKNQYLKEGVTEFINKPFPFDLLIQKIENACKANELTQKNF